MDTGVRPLQSTAKYSCKAQIYKALSTVKARAGIRESLTTINVTGRVTSSRPPFSFLPPLSARFHLSSACSSPNTGQQEKLSENTSVEIGWSATRLEKG